MEPVPAEDAAAQAPAPGLPERAGTSGGQADEQANASRTAGTTLSGARAGAPGEGSTRPGSTGASGPKADSTKPSRSKSSGSKLSGSKRGGAPVPGNRGGAGGTPAGEPGARVLAFPEPAHKRRRRRAWLGVAGVAVVLAVVMGLALFSPVLAVKHVTFVGNKLVAGKTLQAAVAPLLGRPLPQVTQGDLDALLAAVPQIKASHLEARPPSTLVVHVVERVPVALLKDGKGWIQVDQDGVPLGRVADQSKVPLPRIDGGTAATGGSTFRAITAVLATLPKSVLGKLASASAKSPDAVELQMVDGKTVVWGNASDMELKAQVLEALVTAPAPVPVAGKPAPPPVRVYDVSAPLHPVTR